MSETRQRILEAAMRLFYEQGYGATGIATILREADVHPGSLYHAFPNKEALLLGVLKEYQRMLRPVVMDPIERDEPDPIERIFALMRWYRGGMEMTGCRQGCPIGNLALEVSDTNPEARVEIDRNFEGWADSILAWLEQAGDRLPIGCDRRALSRFVLTVMEGGLMQARARDSIEPFDQSVAQLRAYFDTLLERAARATPQQPGRAAPEPGDPR